MPAILKDGIRTFYLKRKLDDNIKKFSVETKWLRKKNYTMLESFEMA